MTWFEALTGFSEKPFDDVRANLRLDGTKLTSLRNGRTFVAGDFSTPGLSMLRDFGELPSEGRTNLCVSELVADVRELHNDAGNEHAVFQVASQFNCLEMAAPHMTPEDGVGVYQNDWTQGPACSICAGAGTIFRNYLTRLDGQIGQTEDKQIDCLADVGEHLGNSNGRLWKMENGYCFPSLRGLTEVETRLSRMGEQELNQMRGELRVGIQSNTEVTTSASGHRVTQVFCSAMPVAYSDIDASCWNHFPRLILDATYEATFHAAWQNFRRTGCNRLYLTLVGGGVFGNPLDWILSSIGRSLKLFAFTELDVKIVSFGASNPDVVSFLKSNAGA